MLEFAKTYFPILVLLLLAVMVLLQLLMVAFWPSRHDLLGMSNQILGIEQKLLATVNLLESIQLSLDRVSNESSDVHALAAHFVPYRQTEQDVLNMYCYQEDRKHDMDPESKFYRNLDELKPQSESAKSSG